MVARFLLAGLLLLILVSTQPACWDQREVERLGIVMAIGVEPASGGRVRVIVQNVTPSAMVRGAGFGGGGGAGGIMVKPYRNRSVESSTILDAFQELLREAPRQLFFAHNQVIILSEELARERGLKDIMDVFERNPQIRRTNWLLVGRGDLTQLLDVPGRVEATPAQRIFNIINEQGLTSNYAVQKLGDFLEMMESEGTHPFTALVETVPNLAVPKEYEHGLSEGHTQEPRQVVRLNGTAVFRGDKLAGWLDQRESRGLLWVRGKVRGGVIDVPAPDGNEKPVSLEILRAKTELRPALKDGQVYMTVEVKAESNLGETTGPLDLTKPEVIDKLEAALAGSIMNEIEVALAKAQREYGVDVFGFGEAVHRKYPREWKEMKEMWAGIFPGVQVELQVDAQIRRTGLVSRPAEPKQQGQLQE